MHYVTVILTAKDETDVDELAGLLTQQAQLSRPEPGCVRFEVYHSQGDRRVFLLSEHWESKEAHEVHRTAKAYNEIYQPQVIPKVDRVAHITDLVDG